MKNFVAKYRQAEIRGLYDPRDGETVFYHIITNQPCKWLDQIFYGWSEQNSEYQREWEKLVELFENDLENGLAADWLDEAEENEITVFDYEHGFTYRKDVK